jgi:hypothetical protein
MKKVPVFDETNDYQIRYTGAGNFDFNEGVCDKRMRITNSGKNEFPEGAGLF